MLPQMKTYSKKQPVTVAVQREAKLVPKDNLNGRETKNLDGTLEYSDYESSFDRLLKGAVFSHPVDEKSIDSTTCEDSAEKTNVIFNGCSPPKTPVRESVFPKLEFPKLKYSKIHNIVSEKQKAKKIKEDNEVWKRPKPQHKRKRKRPLDAPENSENEANGNDEEKKIQKLCKTVDVDDKILKKFRISDEVNSEVSDGKENVQVKKCSITLERCDTDLESDGCKNGIHPFNTKALQTSCLPLEMSELVASKEQIGKCQPNQLCSSTPVTRRVRKMDVFKSLSPIISVNQNKAVNQNSTIEEVIEEEIFKKPELLNVAADKLVGNLSKRSELGSNNAHIKGSRYVREDINANDKVTNINEKLEETKKYNISKQVLTQSSCDTKAEEVQIKSNKFENLISSNLNKSELQPAEVNESDNHSHKSSLLFDDSEDSTKVDKLNALHETELEETSKLSCVTDNSMFEKCKQTSPFNMSESLKKTDESDYCAKSINKKDYLSKDSTYCPGDWTNEYDTTSMDERRFNKINEASKISYKSESESRENENMSIEEIENMLIKETKNLIKSDEQNVSIDVDKMVKSNILEETEDLFISSHAISDEMEHLLRKEENSFEDMTTDDTQRSIEADEAVESAEDVNIVLKVTSGSDDNTFQEKITDERGDSTNLFEESFSQQKIQSTIESMWIEDTKIMSEDNTHHITADESNMSWMEDDDVPEKLIENVKLDITNEQSEIQTASDVPNDELSDEESILYKYIEMDLLKQGISETSIEAENTFFKHSSQALNNDVINYTRENEPTSFDHSSQSLEDNASFSKKDKNASFEYSCQFLKDNAPNFSGEDKNDSCEYFSQEFKEDTRNTSKEDENTVSEHSSQSMKEDENISYANLSQSLTEDSIRSSDEDKSTILEHSSNSLKEDKNTSYINLSQSLTEDARSSNEDENNVSEHSSKSLKEDENNCFEHSSQSVKDDSRISVTENANTSFEHSNKFLKEDENISNIQIQKEMKRIENVSSLVELGTSEIQIKFLQEDENVSNKKTENETNKFEYSTNKRSQLELERDESTSKVFSYVSQRKSKSTSTQRNTKTQNNDVKLKSIAEEDTFEELAPDSLKSHSIINEKENEEKSAEQGDISENKKTQNLIMEDIKRTKNTPVSNLQKMNSPMNESNKSDEAEKSIKRITRRRLNQLHEKIESPKERNQLNENNRDTEVTEVLEVLPQRILRRRFPKSEKNVDVYNKKKRMDVDRNTDNNKILNNKILNSQELRVVLTRLPGTSISSKKSIPPEWQNLELSNSRNTRRNKKPSVSFAPVPNVQELEEANDKSQSEQVIFLKPGKSWARSLSILSHFNSGEDLTKLSIGRGKKWRDSVQNVLAMQTEGSIQSCVKKSDNGKELRSRFSTFAIKDRNSTLHSNRTTASPPRISKRFSIRIAPNKRLSSIKDPSPLEVYAINEETRKNLITRKSSITSLPKRSVLYTTEVYNVTTEVGTETDPIDSAREVVLQRCNQIDYLPFSSSYPKSYLDKCKKIGEGVYGEVFSYESGSEKSVIKIIPIEGSELVNSEPQKKFHEILSEIIITEELHNLRYGKDYNTNGFVNVKSIKCVIGKYPEKLVELWDIYDEESSSENDCPSMFADDQLYIILELAHGGEDLEAFVFNNASESYSLFLQTALALAVAEKSLEFEHRDLHWGNILISRTNETEVNYKLGDQSVTMPTKGVQVCVIDFTLSRMSFQGIQMFNDLALDPALFTAQGEYQFEVYRLMRDKIKNDWQQFEPYTNVLWLHYTLDKMTTLVKYKKKSTKIHKTSIRKLKDLKDEILNYSSAFDFVTNCKQLSAFFEVEDVKDGKRLQSSV